MKTETKYTPGPWTHDTVWNLVIGPNGQEIAAIHSAQIGQKRCNPETAQANAALIASAPAMLEELATLRADKAELLEALQKLLCAYEAKTMTPVEAYAPLWHEARALITKHTKP